eukprot:CAMPEP_0172816350 /NCGR_PEP_ID=MMETSP1075-20121228/12403_1 /TAXON_ID=2916 /ORGANISM="Ceratium fusus, Strain PA161109" /LENGTH=368 /DNA_ID=CAMNT_0013656325 /DNA_START=5 /DNA_END=1111 /DNA_ORIENTATION=+
MAPCAFRRWQVLLLVLLPGAPAAASSRAASATKSSSTLARVAKILRQQPPLEDPEALLAERDDLRAQVATKNAEFLAQHRRADQLLLKVRDLELRLRSEGHMLRTSQTRLQSEEIKEHNLQATLDKVRGALADATNATTVGMSAPYTRDAEAKTLHTSNPRQHDRLNPKIRASQQDHEASSEVLHMHDRASPKLTSHKSKALPAAAARTHAEIANALSGSTGQLNTIKLKRVMPPEMIRPNSHSDDRQENHKQELSEPADSKKVPQPHDKEEGSNTFKELERQLREEDSKIAKLDTIDQEDDSTAQEHPLAVSALVLDTSLRDVSAGDAELHPKAVEHLSARDSDSDLAPLDPASEADAALLASMTKH